MKKALSKFAVLALILTLVLTALPVPALRAEETGASEPLRHFVVENANLTPAEGKVTNPSALFTAAAALDVRCGSAFHVIWNQEREKAGLPQEESEDVTLSVKLGIEAVKRLILADRAK